MLEVRVEKISNSVNEKKTLNPTMKMLEFALSNAGFTNGVWLLKAPHRTRKKGAERFRAMRLDGTGIRVRCKPGGNDTCYEWTLYPPIGMDQDSVFSDLCSLHPNSMRSIRTFAVSEEERSILGGLFDRIVDAKPSLLPVAPAQEPPAEETARQIDIAQEIEQPVKIGSLDLSSLQGGLSSHYAMDRALLAFRICSKGSDFLRRNILSEGFVRLLNIDGLIKKSHMYKSAKGAMRALLPACCAAGYMERMMYGENSTNGYRLTDEGKKRLDFLSSLLEDPVLSQIVVVEEPPVPNEPPAVAKPNTDNKISLLKGLIGEHESVEKEISDLRLLIEELKNETENDELMLSGLRKTLSDRVSEKEALDKEIERLEGKMRAMRNGSEKKAADLRALKADLEKLTGRKAEIEAKLTVR